MLQLLLDDDLYCSEDQQWELEDEFGDVLESSSSSSSSSKSCSIINNVEIPTFELPQLVLFDDEELKQMLFKEGKTWHHHVFQNTEKDQALVESRHGAVDWILKVQSFYSFSPLTAVLAVNYLDKFIFLSLQHSFQKDKLWMTQLAAVACLSLAAKVEEVDVPLLLDLQVCETNYVFEAKTIQKMEILVLSALEWKMNPVNPIAFLEKYIQMLGWSSHIYGNFTQRCELVILLALFDARSMSYPPSIMASATLLHVISNVNPSIDKQFKNKLFCILETDKEKVSECCEFIQSNDQFRFNKRKFRSLSNTPDSPTGVMDATFSFDNSNTSLSAMSNSVTSSPEQPSKRGKMDLSYIHCVFDEV